MVFFIIQEFTKYKLPRHLYSALSFYFVADKSEVKKTKDIFTKASVYQQIEILIYSCHI